MNMFQIALEFLASGPVWFGAVTTIISSAAVIAAVTPTKTDDKIVGMIGKVWNIISPVINTLALNIGKAKNADAE